MTADPVYAAAAQAAGVDRVGVDFEVRGKAERQVSRPSWIAGHVLADLVGIAGVVERERLFVRIHPFELGGRDELDQVLAAGAGVVMLPMFARAEQALEFVRAVDSKAVPVLLLETESAANDLDALLRSELDFEIHLGLNDLGISRGHASPFAMLLDPLLADISQRVAASGRRLCIGRLARVTDRSLPISADLLCALTVSLGGRGSFLSQYFAKGVDPADVGALTVHVNDLRQRARFWAQAKPEELSAALADLTAGIRRMDSAA